jgi:hypothetical protein
MRGGDDCGAFGGMSGRGNRSTERKPAPVPVCPTQTSCDLTRAQTRGRLGGEPATIRLSYGTAYRSLTVGIIGIKTLYKRHDYDICMWNVQVRADK